MSTSYTKKELEQVILDLLDGGNAKWWEIQENTGLEDDRCKEISRIYFSIVEDRFPELKSNPKGVSDNENK